MWSSKLRCADTPHNTHTHTPTHDRLPLSSTPLSEESGEGSGVAEGCPARVRELYQRQLRVPFVDMETGLDDYKG